MPDLQTDIRQFFSYEVLGRFDRLEEAEVQFTFDAAGVYLSVFADAMDHLDTAGYQESDPVLAGYARVLEKFVTSPFPSVSQFSAGLVASSIYWLSGYTANSLLLAGNIQGRFLEQDAAGPLLFGFLTRSIFTPDEPNDEPIRANLRQYLLLGESHHLEEATNQIELLLQECLSGTSPDEFLAASLLHHIFRRLAFVSVWASIQDRASAGVETWQRYMGAQFQRSNPIIDLWPSQRLAISKGLLDNTTSLTLKMPTSAGKTKMSELAFVNDIGANPNSRCLYLAPFRALVAEVESSLGGILSQLDIPTVSLYGGAEANALDAQLTDVAKVVVATPEKIDAVLRLSDKDFSEFSSVVLDEGHLLDSESRGPFYEIQLAAIKAKLAGHGRTIFLSAVLPNSADIAAWLSGSSEQLAEDDWQPTTSRFGVVTWPQNGAARLNYVTTDGQPLADAFFVPRLLEQETWRELYAPTGRERTYRFPEQDNNGSIAAALAFKLVREGPVIIFASRPDWAESIAGRILDRLELQKPIATNLVDDNNKAELAALSDYLAQVLGPNSTLSEAVRHGFAFHHGGLPQSIRLVIEQEYRNQTIRLLIATNTLAQGVNTPAKTVIVHSMPRTDKPIRDFWNLAGRAGRALQESEGEVIILATGSLSMRRLGQFLDKRNVEAVESQIFRLVKELLAEHGGVDQQILDEFFSDPNNLDTFGSVLEALDINLLNLLEDELTPEVASERARGLASDLLASYQAAVSDAEEGTNFTDGVANLVETAGARVLGQVPDAHVRKWFSSSGLAIASCRAAEVRLDDVKRLLEAEEGLTEEVFRAIIYAVSDFKELEGCDADSLSRLGYQWLNMSTYSEIYEVGAELFEDFGRAIKFVEQELCYRAPRAINGLVRLVEGSLETGDLGERPELPNWFLLLPQMLQYGVPSEQLVWSMSMGLGDRNVALWVLQQYQQEFERDPRRSIELMNWSIDSRDEIAAAVEQRWPSYFSRVFREITDRYAQVRELVA